MKLEDIVPVVSLLIEPHSETRYSFCPICKARWRPWVGSYLQCHAKCLYSPADQDAILSHCENTREKLPAISDRLGITLKVLEATVREALKRRRQTS